MGRSANRPKMSVKERAKQFMPFSALKGFEAALREKEKVVVPHAELSEEQKDELDFRLREIKAGDMITIIYFQAGEYIKKTGLVSKIDMSARYIQVVNTKIMFENIYHM